MKLAGTVTTTQATRTDWDAVVIGAGPAGALAARLLAQSDLHTLLVDRARFPRRKVCGGCLSHRALDVLERSGLGGITDQLRTSPIQSICLRAHRRELVLPLPTGAVVSRPEFDSRLVASAIDAGAHFLPETTAQLADADAHRCGDREVSLEQHGRPCSTVAARVVLAAAGLGHQSLGRAGDLQRQIHRDSHIGVNAVVRAFPPCYRPERIYMAVASAGYAGLVRQADGTLNVAAALNPRLLGHHCRAADAVAAILEHAGFPPIASLAHAAWKGTGPLTQRMKCPAARRVFVLGDAAGYVEPFTGEGMTWALLSAESVVPLVRQGVQCWDRRLELQWASVLRGFARQQVFCHLLAQMLRRPLAVRACLGVFSRFPFLARPIVRQLHCPTERLQLECP